MLKSNEKSLRARGSGGLFRLSLLWVMLSGICLPLVSTAQTSGDNYANVLGNIAAGGLSNLYYPSTDRGVGLTFQRAFTVTAEGALGAIFVEFWPDISRHVFHGQ